jgi:pentose-5-phosphate-3-epimerase
MGLVINPEEDVKRLAKDYSFAEVPVIQLMTIHPGPQGQLFIPDALTKIEELRTVGFCGEIYIDGAVNEETLPTLTALSHPPHVLCPGSYLAHAPPADLMRRVGLLSATRATDW